MNREIKFRAWDRDNNKMIYWTLNDLLVRFGDPKYQYNVEDRPSFLFDWNQYTGLKDKNGKEIYENDIIRVNDDRDGDRTYEVIFEKGCYWGNCIYTPRPSTTPQKTLLCDLDFFVYQSKEIIGNIYEHKHLLKENE